MAVPFADPNFTTPMDWWKYNNLVTDNWFGHFLLIIIFVVTYVSLDKNHPDVAFSGSFFLTFTIAMLLWFMELIPLFDIITILILFGFSLVANIIAGRRFG